MSPQEQRNQAHNDINRADLARQVTESPIYIEALTVMKGDLYAQFGRTEHKDHELREELWRQFQTVEKFEKHFTSLMTNGRMAQHTLTMLDRAKKMIGL